MQFLPVPGGLWPGEAVSHRARVWQCQARLPGRRRSLAACLQLLRQTVCSCHVQGNPAKVYKGLELNRELVKTPVRAPRLCGSKSEVCPVGLHAYLFYG